MSTTNSKCLLTCEILWDCFPDAELLGGATLNVAYHINYLNTEPVILSSVGNDRLGEKALNIIQTQWHCSTDYVRVLDEVGTGKVQVTLDEQGDATYEVLTPAAWDYVEINQETLNKNGAMDAFVYGSVFLRSEYNRRQVDQFLKTFKGLKCIDVNLRPPHNSPEMVLDYAAKADFVKANEEELSVLTSDLPQDCTLRDRIVALADKLEICQLCITRAEKAAMLYHEGTYYEGKTFPVIVKDTVGAGDAFFASMIDSLLSGSFDPIRALNRATTIGSWVASQSGAQPTYDEKIKTLIGNRIA